MDESGMFQYNFTDAEIISFMLFYESIKFSLLFSPTAQKRETIHCA